MHSVCPREIHLELKADPDRCRRATEFWAYWDDGEDLYEMRICPCGSSLSIELGPLVEVVVEPETRSAA